MGIGEISSCFTRFTFKKNHSSLANFLMRPSIQHTLDLGHDDIATGHGCQPELETKRAINRTKDGGDNMSSHWLPKSYQLRIFQAVFCRFSSWVAE